MQYYEVIFTDHALFEMERRELTLDQVYKAFHDPDQFWDISSIRRIYQKIDQDPDGKPYLIRVVVDRRAGLSEIVTAYRTSKIKKYLLEES